MKKIILIMALFSIIFSKTIIVLKNNNLNCDKFNQYIHYNNIKEALFHSNYGDTIKICPGIYYENNLKIIKSNLKIIGMNNVVISNETLHNKYNIFTIPSYIFNLEISNLYIKQYSKKYSAIYSNAYIRNIKLKNINIESKGKGIYLDYMLSNSDFSNLNIHSTKEAIYLKTNDTINIKNSNLYSNSNAIKLNGWSSNNLFNLFIKSYKGIDITNGNTKIVNSDLEITNTAINSLNSNKLIILNNKISSKNGIDINKNNFLVINHNSINSSNIGVYINLNRNGFLIKENNISAYNIGIQINKTLIRGNIYKNIIKNANYGLLLFKKKYFSKINITKNCFYNKLNIINKDFGAYFNQNYYNNLQNNLPYIIPIIPKYDYKPLKYCNISNLYNKTFYVKETNRLDHNITTKIINKTFPLEIYTNKPFIGTLCSIVVDQNNNNISKWFKNFFRYQTSTKQTIEGNPIFQVTQANKNAHIKLVWIKNKNITCPIINSKYSSLSIDNFAIRPKKFLINNNINTIYSGLIYYINLEALDNKNNKSKQYNENNTVLLKAIQNNNCYTAQLKSHIEFKNGQSDTMISYPEVGDINITLEENKSNPFAKVDMDDTSEKQLYIEPATISIISFPYKIITNTSIKNNITYDDINLSQYNEINTIIRILNANNKITRNFDQECFSNDINISYINKKSISNSFIGMFKINNTEFNDSNFNTFDNNFSISKNLFHNGESNFSIKFNIYKNKKNPISILDLNISKIISYYPQSNIKNIEIFDKNISFYNLKLYSSPIYTKTKKTFHKMYVLVYDKYKKLKNEIIPHWFVYKKYDKKDISLLGFTQNKIYDNNLSNFYIRILNNNNIYINNKKGYKVAFIHLKTPTYLWNNKYSDLNISLNSNCSNHYCIEYYYSTTTNDTQNNNFNGSVIEIIPNAHPLGIKIYR